MNFNLVEMYNGLLRFNKHILNELAEGLKHLPNIGNGSTNGDHYELENYNTVGDQANTNNFITEFDFIFGPYFVPNKVGTNKKADYNWKRGSDGQDTDKAVCVLLLGGRADNDSWAGSSDFHSGLVRSDSAATVGFFTTVKLD